MMLPPLPLLLLFTLLPALLMAMAKPQQAQHQHLSHRSSSIFDRVKEPTCRPVEIALCRDIPYNRTMFPNPFVELDLASLQSQTEHFKPLIRTQCSPHLLFFICSVFAPMCPDQMPQAVTSCRSVCEEVQLDCIKIFHEFDFPWPSALNCTRFPNPPALCMRPEPSGGNAPVGRLPTLSPTKSPECPPDLVDLEPTNPEAKCAFRCDKTTMFRKDRKEQARLWLLCWALLNATVALFTVCSFWIDRHRFGFPERSVCYLALCALLSAVPHLLRPLLGFDSIGCGQLQSGAKFLLLAGHHQNHACLASFLFSYYFSLAANCWWLFLGFTWYLSASRKWVEEEIGKRSILLHLLAWGMPGVMVAAAFHTQCVDASELTGLCSVGNFDPFALLWLWLVPRLGLTLFGVFLLFAGFLSVCKERNSFRRRGTDTSRLEKFLLKMGSFALIYVLTSMLASLCDFHHLSVLAQWYGNTIRCKMHGGVFSGQCVRPEQPKPELYVLGQTMALAAGLATGLWMFSPKTLTSWKRALLCCWPVPAKSTAAVASSSPPLVPAPYSSQQQQQPIMPAAAAASYSSGAGALIRHHQLHSSRPSSSLPAPPSSQQPLLYTSSNCVLPPPTIDPPSLPPPPPTAVPSSSTAAAVFGQFFPTQSAGNNAQHHQQQQQHYIPLSVLTTTHADGTTTARSAGSGNVNLFNYQTSGLL